MNNKSIKNLFLYLGIAAVFVLSDGLIKESAEHPEKRIKMLGRFKEGLILKDNIRLRYLRNYGAAGSMLKDRPEIVKALSMAFSAISVAELSMLCSEDRRVLEKIGLSLIIAGGTSNTIDRVTKGYVTDYFSFTKGSKKLRDLVFNISDFEIFAGSILYSIGRCVNNEE